MHTGRRSVTCDGTARATGSGGVLAAMGAAAALWSLKSVLTEPRGLGIEGGEGELLRERQLFRAGARGLAGAPLTAWPPGGRTRRF